MDNFKLGIRGEGQQSLDQALEIAFRHNCPGGRVTHYKEVRLWRALLFLSGLLILSGGILGVAAFIGAKL